MKPRIKKYILSSFLVAAFVVYAFFERSVNRLNGQVNKQPPDKANLAASDTGASGGVTHLSARLPARQVDRPIKPPVVVAPPPRPPVLAKAPSSSGQAYKDGIYTGAVADAYYGPVQVKITVSSGKIINAAAVVYPRDNQTSVLINNQAIPALKTEALKAQSAQINVVSGATYTSYGYATSLVSALAKAENSAVAKSQPKSAAAPSGTALTPPPVATSPALTPPATVPPVNTPPVSVAGAAYKDGQYTGGLIDVYYGNVQVQATIQGGRLADVQFLSYPQDRQTSVIINNQATPILRSEALAAQNAQVNIVSGATYTSAGFIQSLTSALSQAAVQAQPGTPSQPSIQPPASQPTQTPVQLPQPRGGREREGYDD